MKCNHSWFMNKCWKCGQGKYDDGDIAVRAIKKQADEIRLTELENAVRELKRLVELNLHGGH